MFEPGVNAVTVRLYSPVDFIKYRNGAGPWVDPDRVSDTEYVLHVDTTYEVITACVFGVSADSELRGAAADDGDVSLLGCALYDDVFGGPSKPGASTATVVSGRMVQPGSVEMGGSARSASAPWSFAFRLKPDVYDLIAIDTQGRVALRRNYRIGPDAETLPTIDTSLEGAALATTPFQLYGVVIGETVAAETYLETEHEFTIIDGTTTQLPTLPPALREPTDRQTYVLSAYGTSTWREVEGPITGTGVQATLLPLLAKDMFVYSAPDNRTLTASYTTLPQLDELELELYGYPSTQSATFTRRFLEAQPNRVAFDTPPSFLAPWRVDLRMEYMRITSVTLAVNGVYYVSERRDDITNVTGN